MAEAALYLQRKRMEGKEAFDFSNQLRTRELAVNDMVLLHDIKREGIHTGKLEFRWFGPYQIHEIIPTKGIYKLKELDETLLAGTVAGNRLKKFHPRQQSSSVYTPINNTDVDVDDDSNNQGSTTNEEGEKGPIANDQRTSLIPKGWPLAVVILRRRASFMKTVE